MGIARVFAVELKRLALGSDKRMKIEVHHHHHLGAEDLKIFLAFKQGLSSIQGKLDKVLEALNFMGDKLKEQETQLQSVITEIKTGLSSMKSRVDGIVARLETKNDSTTEIDLSDELSELKTVSSSINEMFSSSTAATTESGSAGTVGDANADDKQPTAQTDPFETDVDSTRDQLRTPVREPVDGALLDSMEEKPATEIPTPTENENPSSSDVIEANQPSDPGETDPSNSGRRLVNS